MLITNNLERELGCYIAEIPGPIEPCIISSEFNEKLGHVGER